jgi:Lipopolysaccharide-assembly
MPVRIRTCWIGLTLLAMAMVAAGCTSEGHFRIFGYTTEPTYDPSIRTVFVPIAKNATLRRGLEFQLTMAVIREINSKPGYMRTVSCAEGADTELDLKIINWNKNVIIATPTNQVRQAQLGLGIEVVWKDLRPGKIGEVLSNPKSALAKDPPLPGQIATLPAKAIPVVLLPIATYEPELGGSNATAEQQLIDRVAVQIVYMMEKSW